MPDVYVGHTACDAVVLHARVIGGSRVEYIVKIGRCQIGVGR